MPSSQRTVLHVGHPRNGPAHYLRMRRVLIRQSHSFGRFRARHAMIIPATMATAIPAKIGGGGMLISIPPVGLKFNLPIRRADFVACFKRIFQRGFIRFPVLRQLRVFSEKFFPVTGKCPFDCLCHPSSLTARAICATAVGQSFAGSHQRAKFNVRQSHHIFTGAGF